MVRVLTDKNRMSLLFPKVAKQWHPTLNGDLTPNDISYGSNKAVWWLCGNGHEWEDTVNHRCIGSRGCPGCSGHKVYEDNCLATVNPELAAQWHPTLNGELTPKDVTKSSDKVVWWVCEKGHEWESNITNRTNGNGCPGCSGKKAYKDNCLATLRPDIAAQWHPTLNGELTPYDVTVRSGKEPWWICEKGHEWQVSVYNRTNGNGCPYCSGKKVCEDNCLATLRPDIAVQWHPTKNGSLTPKDFTCGSDKKVWWLCDNGHMWKTSIENRTYLGYGCPQCSKGPRSKVGDEWLDSLSIPQECREITLFDLKMRVDAFVPEINTVYEFFGDYWHGNPDRFDLEDFNKHNGKTFGELYEETKTRINRLVNAGYKIVYIWEMDYRK